MRTSDCSSCAFPLCFERSDVSGECGLRFPHDFGLLAVLRSGQPVLPRQSLQEARNRVKTQLAGFHAGIKRIDNPHAYPVGLEQGLHERKTALVLAARTRAGKD